MFRLLVILLLSASVVSAQSLPAATNIPPAKADRATTQFTAADTVQAIQNLFRHRRTGAKWGVGLAAATSITPYIVGKATETESRIVRSDTHLIAGVLVSLPLWVLAGKKYSRYAVRRESEIIVAYQAGQPLPLKIKRRLA